MMGTVHDHYGRLPWKLLFLPTKTKALKGFELTERTSSRLAGLPERNASCADDERVYFRASTAFEYFADTDD